MKLLAVRHGQASFHAADYDQLSDTGIAQARALGHWLLNHNEPFDRIVCGQLKRHAQTWQAIQQVMCDAGRPLPDCVIDPAFDEFDHRQVLAGFMQLHPEHPASHDAEGGMSHDPAQLFILLRAALQRWSRGELDRFLNEPWAEFKRRTRDAAQRLVESSHNQSVLLISSGGVIAQIAAAAMEAPDHRAVELNLSLRNSALCELHGDEQGLRLGSWNGLPHLAEQRSLWTYV